MALSMTTFSTEVTILGLISIFSIKFSEGHISSYDEFRYAECCAVPVKHLLILNDRTFPVKGLRTVFTKLLPVIYSVGVR